MEPGAPPNTETLHLAGLAAANGPWLAARLRRLAETSGLALPPQVVDSAVEQCSLTLRRIVKSEGRPAFAADMDSDPASELGRQQARVHMEAGLDLPGSLRVLRLMRRCYDDLIRESWIDDKLSRTRAHEDVERVFERTLLGLYVAWAEVARPCPEPPAPERGEPKDDGPQERQRLAGLLARREAELRRTLEAAHKAAEMLRAERARTRQLEAELTRRGQQAAQTAEAAELGLAAHVAAARTGAEQHREGCVLALAAFLELTGEALAAVDAAGRFEAHSPRFAELFGLQAADLAQGLDALLPRMAAALREPGPFLERMRGLWSGAAPESGEARPLLLSTRSGRTLALRTRLLPGSGGGPRLRLIALRDVTQEHDARRLLGELEAATRLEPGGPGSDLLRLSQELTDGDQATPELARRLSSACACGWDVLGAVRQAVDVYALEHGLAAPAPDARLDLALAARQAVELAAPLAAARQVALVLTSDTPSLPPGAPPPPDLSLPGPGDQGLAQGLVGHLLRDALAATPPGGEVDLVLCARAGAPELSVTRPRELPKGARAGFFDKPGPGGESLSAAAAPGHPPARYAARLMAQALGGELTVASAHGRGTTVTLRLPGP